MVGDAFNHSQEFCIPPFLLGCLGMRGHGPLPRSSRAAFRFLEWLFPLFLNLTAHCCTLPESLPSVLPFGASVMACRDIHLSSQSNMRTSVPTDSQSGCSDRSVNAPLGPAPRSRAFDTLYPSKLHSSVKLVFLILHSQPVVPADNLIRPVRIVLANPDKCV